MYYSDYGYDSALRLFRREMHETRGIWKPMQTVGYEDYTKVLTRNQVKTIVTFLGAPLRQETDDVSCRMYEISVQR